MTTTVRVEDKQTVLTVEGRVDTNTSPQLQKDILSAVQTTKRLVIDFSGVVYLSSAGLRALLIGHKAAGAKRVTLELKSPTPLVRSVLESVGFSKVLTITD